MHGLKITHNNLLLENIFVGKSRNEVALANFSLARKEDAANFSPSNDCVSFGLMLCELVHNGSKETVSQARKLVARGDFRQARQSIVAHLHRENPVDQVIEKLLSENPQDRPPMSVVKARLEAIRKQVDVEEVLKDHNLKNFTNMSAAQIEEKKRHGEILDMFTQVSKGEPISKVYSRNLQYMRDVAYALSQLHTAHYAYGGLSVRNLLLDMKTKSPLLAGAKCISVEDSSFTGEATPYEKDCLDFGIALFAMLHGKEGLMITEKINITGFDSGIKEIRSKLNMNNPGDALIADLISQDHSKIPSMEEVVRRIEEHQSNL
jgi:tRNA A-37 threonylcarbamoyl transferase component Bud32